MERSHSGYLYRPKSRADSAAYLERFNHPRVHIVEIEVYGDGFIRVGITVDAAKEEA
jgi:hypothetical protein